jgi:hypothetical protein
MKQGAPRNIAARRPSLSPIAKLESAAYREESRMKWVSVYLVGYVLVVIGIGMALWKVGVLERLGGFWIAVGVIVAIGIGIILSISGSGEKETVEVKRS